MESGSIISKKFHGRPGFLIETACPTKMKQWAPLITIFDIKTAGVSSMKATKKRQGAFCLAAYFAFTMLPMSHAACAESPLLALRGERRPSTSQQRVDARAVERLKGVIIPLLRAMNHPIPPSEVRVGIVADPDINAANAGSGQFYVTTGLLEKATDDRLRGVLAHEIAHDDLGHVAKTQLLVTGLNLGAMLLEQIVPGSGQIAPIAGTILARGYSRSEEFEADRHGVEILRRAGYSKEVMIDALSWIMRTSGDGGGGFLSTHPALEDRIVALRKMR